VTLTLTLGGVEVTLVRMWSRSTHTPNYMEIGKTFCGRTDGLTDTPQFQSTRSSVGDDLKIKQPVPLLGTSVVI